MSQTYAALSGTDTVTAGRTIINNNEAALLSSNSGTSAPSYAVEGTLFAKTDTNVLQVYDGASWNTVLPNYATAGGGLLPLTGGTMSGAINMGSQSITNVANASASGDAVNKSQVDGRVLASCMLVAGLSGTADLLTFIMPAAGTISACKIVSDTATTGSSAGTRWEFNLYNFTQSESLASANKVTSAAEISANVAYDLALNQNLTGIAAGDVFQLKVTKTGSPTSLTSARIVVMIAYTVTT